MSKYNFNLVCVLDCYVGETSMVLNFDLNELPVDEDMAFDEYELPGYENVVFDMTGLPVEDEEDVASNTTSPEVHFLVFMICYCLLLLA